ncbi:sensor protein kinase WalK [Peptococcaceae bacterium CEB3]|nr:sensor protein kinase WalK [Peptococcaceae bacterium CEB3]
MNLKWRLSLANTLAVLVPVGLTVLVALAYLFLYGQLSGLGGLWSDYQKMAEVHSVVLSSEKSILEATPGAVEKAAFQQRLRDDLAGIQGEVVIIKNGKLLFSSRSFSKIAIAKFLEEGKASSAAGPVEAGGTDYVVREVDLRFKDGSQGYVLLLAPVTRSLPALGEFLFLLGASFVLSFLAMNFWVSVRFSRSILSPLSNLRQAAAEISRGNLDCQIAEEGDEEIRALCRDLERMRIKLKDSVHIQMQYEDNRKMLISSISHDLQTPVTSIKGYVEGILDGVANTPEKERKYLQTIHVKAEQIDQMIEDLLLYAKLDLHQVPFNFEKTDAEDYLRDCIEENEAELARRQIEITLRTDLPQRRELLLDRERMKRVLVNILDNACKYMNKTPGKITLILRETPAGTIVEVRDNGAGIPAQDLPRIFDRFFRSDLVGLRKNGSGLGLAIAKQIVEGHGGRIWAVSGEGVGTSIMISLPKGAGGADRAVLAPKGSEVRGGSGGSG